MNEAGCEVARQEFEIGGQTPRQGVNVIGALGGKVRGAPAVLVGAHYDTRPNSPGADDNASGVAAMLECATALSGATLERPLIFAAFDAEERQDPLDGLWGSTAYVRSLSRPADVYAAFILEMVGCSTPPGSQKVPTGFKLLWPRTARSVAKRRYAGDFLVALCRGRSGRAARLLAASSRGAGGPHVYPLPFPRWAPVPRDLLRSDHAPFWAAGIPAVLVGDTANYRNPHYHLPSDTTETVDLVMVEGTARALATTVAKLAAKA